MNKKVVEIKNIVKRFGGFTALDKISFNVEAGEVFGLIGPNGAGKTTTMRILATLLLPSEGYIRILGYDPVNEASKIRPLLSYLAEDAGTYRNLSGYEYLKIVAKIYFKSKIKAEKAIKEAISISGLGIRIKDRMKNYSKGMKRRIQVARALMINPQIAILDEPTSGLDVFHAHHVRSLVKDHAKNGGAVVLSSHNMLEVEYLCSRIAFIHRGCIVAEGTPEVLKVKFGTNNLEEIFMEVIQR